jgi:hypothetical protein
VKLLAGSRTHRILCLTPAYTKQKLCAPHFLYAASCLYAILFVKRSASFPVKLLAGGRIYRILYLTPAYTKQKLYAPHFLRRAG